MIIHQDSYRHKGLRKRLSEYLEKSGIKDRHTLEAIGTLPRHFFLPPEFESHAYEDKAFPIGEDQTISQPYTVAYQTQLLEIGHGMKILEIGTGSGYQAAILSLCGAEVFSIERLKGLSDKARDHLKAVSENSGILFNIHLHIGDGTKGLPSHAPYDRILVTAGAPSVPKSLITQLKVGGLLVIPVGKEHDTQKMVRITKLEDDNFETEILSEFSFVPLVGENGWKPGIY